MFIVFEGPDGTGKSTQINMLKEKFEQAGHKVVLTREPGGCVLSEAIREMLLDPAHKGMDPAAEALLYAAARAQHIQSVILPALERGDTVLCDRYLLSSLAYQGYSRELGEEWIWSINRCARENAMPDVTFLFTMDAETALARKRTQQAHELDRIELEKEAFHNRVAQGFEACRNAYPGIVTVNAADTIENIHQKILQNIRELQN